MPRRGAATVAEVLKEEASWSQIREWSKARDQMEASIARVLRAKLDRLGEKVWLEECEREMAWSRATAYRHLNPEKMAKSRQDTANARANVSTVETLEPSSEPPFELSIVPPSQPISESAEVQPEASEKLADPAVGKVLKGTTGGKNTPKAETAQHFPLMKYGTGKRSIESVIDRVSDDMKWTGVIWMRVLADAKQMNHPNCDRWMKEATAWHIQMAAGLDLLKGETVPTLEALETIFNPDDQREDEAAVGASGGALVAAEPRS
jgi:hypothetical protein